MITDHTSDPPGHRRSGPDDRQHRHARQRVILPVAQRQRPGVRRGPAEDDGEQDERRPGDRSGHGSPADQRREATGDATPDDVLRRPPLQPQRVDEDVEGVRRQRQAGGQPVDEETEPQGGRHAEDQPEDGGRARADGVPRQRASPGPPHLLVDVPVQHAVDRVRAGRGQAAADHGQGHQPETRNPAGGQEHGRHGRDQQQLDDPGLGQADVRRDDVTDSDRAVRDRARDQIETARGRSSFDTRPVTSMLVTRRSLWLVSPIAIPVRRHARLASLLPCLISVCPPRRGPGFRGRRPPVGFELSRTARGSTHGSTRKD